MNRLKTFIISILAIMATNISYAQTEQVKKVAVRYNKHWSEA